MKNLLFALTAILFLGLSWCGQSEAAVPGQYIAKLYTEALGRAPDPQGWQGWTNWFQQSGCSQTTLAQAGGAVFFGQEYANLGYDNVEKIITAYRAIVSREPDPGAIPYWINYFNTGGTFTAFINGMFTWPEFLSKIPAICSGNGYGFSGWPVDNSVISTYGTGYSGNQAGLQALIDATPPGGIVYLKNRAVIYITSPLSLKAGVVLMTSGSPGPQQYAKQARLVRAGDYWGPVMIISYLAHEPGGTQVYNELRLFAAPSRGK